MSILNNCTEEKDHPRSYPRVKTNPVTNITANGATFSGDIFSLGTEPVIQYGFVWDDNKYATLADDKVLLGPTDTPGLYSADIVTALTKDVEYTVKSFVQTADHIYYGLPVTFVSLGSGAPVVTGFEPDSAAWLDTIKISGKNFAGDLQRDVVSIGSVKCKVISGTDSTLFVEVSTGVSQIQNLVSVEISGNKSQSKESLKLMVPRIKELNPLKAFWGDTVTIKGKHFRSFNTDKNNYIKLESTICERVGQYNDSILQFKVPDEIAFAKSSLKMQINGISVYAGSQIELLEPYFTFSPKNGTWGSAITLSGRFNSTSSRNQITFKSNSIDYAVQPEDIVSTSHKSIKFRVPQGLGAIVSAINYTSSPFSITAVDSFRLNPPVIISFSPLSGPEGMVVTIKGKNLLHSTVKFGAIEANVITNNDSTITVITPFETENQVQIVVTSAGQTTVSTNYFQFKNPKITSFSPTSGTFYDELTITGENFISPKVTFNGTIPVEVVSSTPTTIVIRVPINMNNGPKSVSVTCGSSIVIAAQSFTLLPPQITSVSPSGTLLPGQDITVTGNNFNPEAAYNSVYWDTYPLTIISATKTQIVATLPSSLPRATYPVTVVTGGYTQPSTQNITIRSQWRRIESPQVASRFWDGYWGGTIAYGQSIKNFGYVCSEEGGATYRFDPAGDSWTQLAIASPFDYYSKHVMMGQVVYKDTLYLIGGRYNSSVKSFYDGIGSWSDMPSPAQKSGVAFSLNDKIYFGLDYWYPTTTDFYEYDPVNNRTWVRKGDFPFENQAQISAYFTVGGKGYVVFTDNSVYQFNADNYTWTRIGNFPGTSRVLAFSFVIGSQAYIGGGHSTDYPPSDFNDLWMFDPSLNTWTLKSNIPGARHAAVAFSIGSKAYVGYGLQVIDGMQNNMYDFYEFDPNYVAK